MTPVLHGTPCSGAVETSAGEVLLRLNERRQWADEFARIEIVTADSGAAVTLGEIATITDGFEEGGFHSQFNQQPSVQIEIFRIGEQSPLEIAERVEAIMADFETTLPAGVQWRIDSNSAKDYEQRLSLLMTNGFMAIGIVLVILAIFLEIRLAFWVMMGMTISFVGSLLFMPVVGVSVNMISMFAFLVVLGIVVDDAIVVGENIVRHRKPGVSPMLASLRGSREVLKTVLGRDRTFSFTGLHPGRYVLVVEHPEGEPLERSVDLVPAGLEMLVLSFLEARSR